MFRTILIPGLALGGLVLAINTVLWQSQPIVPARPVADPAQAPFAAFVAGSGVVEASTENISIGAPVGGLVTELYVNVGDSLEAGDPLFKIDDRSLQADLVVRQATIVTAQANLQRLLALPRTEEIPPAEARVDEIEAELAGLRERLAMWESVQDRRAVSAEEFATRRSAVASTEARLGEARAALALIKAGAFEPDIAVARAQLAAAMVQRDQIAAELERLTVRAPLNCTILQVNVRPGEYAAAGVLSKPLMVVGGTKRLRIRVDVDENDAWRIEQGRQAMAYVRGNSQLNTNLIYVRTEPLVVPKKSLTGESTERVDTRVLQVIYEFDPAAINVYVGQLMDVYIDAPPIHARSAASDDQVLPSASDTSN